MNGLKRNLFRILVQKVEGKVIARNSYAEMR